MLTRAVLFFVALLPLSVGFAASAIANRLAFAGWGIAVAGLACLLFLVGLRRAWNGWATGGRIGLAFALGSAWLARLVARHAEALDLGLAATAEALRRPALLDPRTYLYVAIVWSVAGVLSILISHGAGGTRRFAPVPRGWRERPRPIDVGPRGAGGGPAGGGTSEAPR